MPIRRSDRVGYKQPPEREVKDSNSKTINVLTTHREFEFGGPVGALAIVIGSPIIIFYLWACIKFNEGHAIYPQSLGDFIEIPKEFISYAAQSWPTRKHVLHYTIFILAQFIMAFTLPGVNVKGFPIKMDDKTMQLNYKCNAYMSWNLILVLIPLLHFSNIFDITSIVREYGQYMIVAFGYGILISILTYVLTRLFGEVVRPSGSAIYDFFVGAPLNPRIGPVDLKMFAEIRISWPILYMITLSAVVDSYTHNNRIHHGLINLLLGHFLYTNACAKGETLIPATWDIVYEKWGYMVIFWNIAGVPFFYGLSSYFLVSTELGRSISNPAWLSYTLMILATVCYVLWDVMIAQKSHFRQTRDGLFVTRRTIWTLPYSELRSYDYLITACGSKLLISSLWRYARKLHYTLDQIVMICWAMNTGFKAFAPFFHPVFFLVMLLHRCHRDEERCRIKYGKDWDRYMKAVPYRFIPYVY